MTAIATQWLSPYSMIAAGTQLQLSHFVRTGDLAQACHSIECSHRCENHRSVKLRPEWKVYPAYISVDYVPWEWVCTETAFNLTSGDQVLVLALVDVTFDAPPGMGPEPWTWQLACVHSFRHAKVGWCQAYMLEVPFLL